ncbi:IS3 family transposase [Streptomyces sp. NPDC086549]|uniref:IS3 family transposase n=1 Tax=Streptomyces sp. NPDC086549 TaxID=3365752 RepID=UPI0037FDCB67
MSVHPFIEAEKQAGHSVKRACELLKVSRAAFYAHRTGALGPRAVRDAQLTEQITVVHEQCRGTCGAPGVHAVLKREGTTCGRRRVARLMRAAGLTGRHRRRRHRTTIPDPHAGTRPDLLLRESDRQCDQDESHPRADVGESGCRREVGPEDAHNSRRGMVAERDGGERAEGGSVQVLRGERGDSVGLRGLHGPDTDPGQDEWGGEERNRGPVLLGSRPRRRPKQT